MSHNIIIGVLASARLGGGGGGGTPTDAGASWILDATFLTDELALESDLVTLTHQGATADYRFPVPTEKQAGPDVDILYWEVVCNVASASTDSYQGVADGANPPVGDNPISNGSMGRRGNGTIWEDNGQQVTSLQTFGALNDVLMMAFQPSTGSLWTGVNGTWDNDPDVDAANHVMAFSPLPLLWKPVVHTRNVGESFTLVSTATNFAHTVPASATALADYVATFYDVFPDYQSLYVVTAERPINQMSVDLQRLYVVTED